MPTLDQFREFMAAQAKATPGPWELRECQDNEWVAVYPDGEDSSICNECDARLLVLARSLPVAEWIAERERMEKAMREAADELRKWVRLSGLQWPAKLAAKLESALNEQGARE